LKIFIFNFSIVRFENFDIFLAQPCLCNAGFPLAKKWAKSIKTWPCTAKRKIRLSYFETYFFRLSSMKRIWVPSVCSSVFRPTCPSASIAYLFCYQDNGGLFSRMALLIFLCALYYTACDRYEKLRNLSYTSLFQMFLLIYYIVNTNVCMNFFYFCVL